MSTYHLGIQYAENVISGEIVACKYVKQACERFLDELNRDDWRWKFDINRANHAISFMHKAVKHVKGEMANKLIVLEPWQVFILMNIYGWVDPETNERRFQYVILEVARKNGKSLFASGIAIYDLLFGEEGGEVYSLATKRDQARIAWDAAVRMVNIAPKKVKDNFQSFQSSLTCPKNWSKYIPLGRDSKSLDGLNPSLCIFDEAAAYSDRNLVEVMTSATGARKNFMHLFITTAQFNKSSVYYENRQYLEGILEKRFDNDRWFGVIYTLDDEDDYEDESVWLKANPGLDVSVTTEFLRNEVKQASEMTAKRNSVLVKHFNVWTSSSESWLDVARWDDPEVIVDSIDRSGELYIGMDLAMTRDLCAVTSLYVNGDVYHADFKCFLPEEAMRKAPAHVSSIYREAHKAGTLVFTDGDVTDYNFIQSYVEGLAKNHNLQAIAYDPFNATQLVTNLQDFGLNMLEVRQGISYLSPAAKETETCILKQLIKHEKDPFISWQLENCTVYTDLNDNIKVRKGDDENRKIDSIIGLIMAISLAAGKLNEPKSFDMLLFGFD